MIKVFTTEVTQYALKLEEQEDGSAVVRIVNAQTGIHISCGNLVSITKYGLYRPCVVNKDAAKALGIPLDDIGRIRLGVEEGE